MIPENRVWVVYMGMKQWYASTQLPQAFHAYLATIHAAMKDGLITGSNLVSCVIEEREPQDLATLAALVQLEKGGELILPHMKSVRSSLRRQYFFNEALDLAYSMKWAYFDEGEFHWVAKDDCPMNGLPPIFEISKTQV